MRGFGLALLLTFFLIPAFAQTAKSRSELEAEKKRNLERIEEVKKVLGQTQKDKKVSMSEALTIQRQIRNHEKKISLANEELDLIKSEIQQNQKAQDSLKSELSGLQKEYARIIVRESKNSSKLNKIGFLFSSHSVTEMFIRYKYLKQYAESRKMKLAKIQQLNTDLEKRRNELSHKRENQSQVVTQISTDKKELDKLKVSQDKVVKELSTKEKQLKTELQKQQQALNRLNSSIAVVIAKEQAKRKAEEEARKAAELKTKLAEERLKTTTAPKTTTTPEKTVAIAEEKAAPTKTMAPAAPTRTEVATVASGKFSAAKKKLAWPASGFVASKFGVSNHAVLKGIKVDNHGIDIRTAPQASVKAVFEGTILDISEIPGLNNVIVVQHGDYYTVYANLSTVAVKVNQKVKGQDILGTAAEKDGAPEINFQVWHNFTKLDPEDWLAPR